MKNYTENEPVVRGGRWPPGDGYMTVTISNSDGWTTGAEDWNWGLELAQEGSITAHTEVGASTGSLSGNDLTLSFRMVPTATNNLPGTGPTTLRVELVSYEGTGTTADDTRSNWYDMTGRMKVYDPWE